VAVVTAAKDFDRAQAVAHVILLENTKALSPKE